MPRRFDQKTDRNKNVMVVGGSGVWQDPLILSLQLSFQMNCSYFVTDPKATLAAELREALESAGYRVVEFSTIDMNGSAHYNPIAYVKNEADVLTFVECLIRNTSGDFGEHWRSLLGRGRAASVRRTRLLPGVSLPRDGPQRAGSAHPFGLGRGA